MTHMSRVGVAAALALAGGLALAATSYRAECSDASDGWTGPDRASELDARADAAAHERASPGHRAFVRETAAP